MNNSKYPSINISDIKRNIECYNKYQMILNEEAFGTLQNDSVVIVIQVSLFCLRQGEKEVSIHCKIITPLSDF